MSVPQAAQGLWLLFLASWCAAMLWTAKATSRGAAVQRIAYAIGFAIGFGLLFAAPMGYSLGGMLVVFGGTLPGSHAPPLWHDGAIMGWLLVAIEVAAFGFAWWARLHLGRLWSGLLTLREGHRVVDSGPYRLVRHPIYTGLITAGWAFALIVATAMALAGATVLTIVMTVKAKGEERLLRRELGTADYDAYAARTPMIVPFAPR